MAATACASGRIRLNGTLVAKTHQAVRPGDVLTFPLGRRIRVVRILALGGRRGPAVEAQALYEDLSPDIAGDSPAACAEAPGGRAPGSGRPTKSERRATDRLRGVG